MYLCLQVAHECLLTPQIFCPSKLVDQGAEEDQGVLKKHCQSWVDLLFRYHVAIKQNPYGSNERPKHHHEADEEPKASTCSAKTALSIGVASHLTIRHSIDHEEGYGGEDSTRVEGMVHLFLRRVAHRRINHDPPACEELLATVWEREKDY